MKPFNPLDKRNLGESVAKELLSRPAEALPLTERFEGAGVYVIYYSGHNQPYPLYDILARYNQRSAVPAPIYVGKAIPAGARIGGLGLDAPPGTVLFNRLREHAESIPQTQNLSVQDFSCKYLIVDDIWIPLGESLLIEMFSPIWNTTITGFGNHDPGGGRYNQQRSIWDTLHTGRAWAVKLQPNGQTEESIINRVAGIVAQRYPLTDPV